MSFFDFDFRFQRLHLVVEEDFSELPRFSICRDRPSDAICDALLIEGSRRGGVPLVALPDWRAERVEINDVSFAHIQVDRGDLQRLDSGESLTMNHVHVAAREVVIGERSVELVEVSGFERVSAADIGEPQPQPGHDVFHDDGTIPDVVLVRCPDVVEMSATWAVRRPAAPSWWWTTQARYDAFAHHSSDVVIDDCPRMRKVAHRVHGPARLVLRDLPALEHLPIVSPAVMEVELTRLAKPLLHTFRLPTRASTKDPPSAMERLTVRGCGLTSMGERMPLNVRMLDLSENKLTSVPLVVHNASRTLDLILDGNPITTLPAVLPKLSMFSCVRCNLSGVVDVSSALVAELNLEHNTVREVIFAGVEETIRVGWNALESLTFPHGPLPPNIKVLSAPHNQLRALSGRTAGVYEPELPVTLKELDVSYNQLTGLSRTMPWSVKTLRAQHNQLTELPPLGTRFGTFGVLDLEELDVSWNALTSIDTRRLRDEEHHNNQLRSVNVEHNALSDWGDIRRLIAGRAKGVSNLATSSSQLTSLHAGWNNFSTPHDGKIFSQRMDNLRTVSLSHNAFSGPLPADLERLVPELEQMRVRGAGFAMADDAECLAAPASSACMGPVQPGRLVREATSSGASDDSVHSVCPKLVLAYPTQGRLIDVDFTPAYHRRALCECVFGYWRTSAAAECVPAPPNTVAHGGTDSHALLAERGHWMCEDYSRAVACPRETYDACAPDADADTSWAACGAGTRGYLCADCASGWYRWAGSCRVCPASVHTARAMAVLAAMVIGVAGLAAAFLLPTEHDAAFKLGVFTAQLAALLGYTTVAISPFFKGFLQLLSIALLELPYLNGCVLAHSAHVPALGVYVLIALVLGVPLVVFAVRAAVVRERVARAEWAARCARAACVLFWLAWQRMLVVLPAYFQCDAAACPGGGATLARYPFAACARAAPLAVYLCVVVPLPVAALAHTARRGEASPFAFLTHGLPSVRAAALALALQWLLGLVVALRMGDRVFTPFGVFVLLAAAHEVVARSRALRECVGDGLHRGARVALLGMGVCYGVVVASHASLLARGQEALDGILVAAMTLLLGGVGAATMLSAAWTTRLRGMLGKWAPMEDSGL